MLNFLRRWNRYLNIILGKSYYHQEQGVGKAFKPFELAGYFNDLTHRTVWQGETDSEGIPLNVLLDGQRVYFETTVIVKALGHFDKWLLFGRKDDYAEFVKLANWLVNRQDENGGWNVGQFLPRAVVPYSALVQGEAISFLTRVYKVTRQARFKEAAQRAFPILVRPVEKGGVAYFTDDGLFLEEIPTIPRNTILNGWVFALMGIYDYWLAFDDIKAKELFSLSLDTLKRHLSDYDAGYWSYYDIMGHIASTFYHSLHIALMEALCLISPFTEFKYYKRKWEACLKRKFNRLRATIVKGYQKIIEPSPVVVIK